MEASFARLTHRRALPDPEAEFVLGLSKVVLHHQHIVRLLVLLGDLIDGQLGRVVTSMGSVFENSRGESLLSSSHWNYCSIMHLPMELKGS